MRLNQRFEVPPKACERGRKITVLIRFVAGLSITFSTLSSAARSYPEQFSWVPRLEPRYLLVVAIMGFALLLLSMLGSVLVDEGKPESPKGAE